MLCGVNQRGSLAVEWSIYEGCNESHACVQLTKFARLLFGMTAALVLSNFVWFLPYYKRMAELGG